MWQTAQGAYPNGAPGFASSPVQPWLRRYPPYYAPLLALSTVLAALTLMAPATTLLVWVTRLSAAIGLLLLLNDGLIMWRRGGIVGRLTINFGVFYWFWLGAWQRAGADPPFPTPDHLYLGFAGGVPMEVVATSLLGVNLFALTALLGWRYLPQPRRAIGWLADRVDPRPAYLLDLMALGLVLLAWVPLALAYQGDLATALQDLMRMRGGGQTGPSADAGLSHHLGLLGVFGAALALARLALGSPGFVWARYLSVGMIFPILFFGQSSRFNFGYLLMPAVLILIAPSRHRLRWSDRRMRLSFLVAVGALLMLYQGAIRTTGLVVQEEEQAVTLRQTLAEGFYGHDHFGAMMIAVDLADATGFFMEPMAPLFLTHFIPRRLWPDKPYSVSWTAYNLAWTQGHAFNVTPSITGQYYLNWGYAGVLYIGFFIGWLARFCESWFARLDIQRQLMSATVAGLLLGFVFLSFRFFYPLYFAYPLFGFLAYWVLARRLPRRRPGWPYPPSGWPAPPTGWGPGRG